MSRKVAFLSLLVLGIGVFVYFIYSKINPVDAVWMPKCFSYTLFGIQCPGCGTQRALHSLFCGDFRAAFFFNPLLLLSVPYFLMVVLLESKHIKQKFPRLHHLLLGERAIWILILVLFIYTVLRNYFEF